MSVIVAVLTVSLGESDMQEKRQTVAPRVWLVAPVLGLGRAWEAFGVSGPALGLVGFASLVGLLAIWALGKRNRRTPFPLLADILIGVLFSLWVRWGLDRLFDV